MNRTLNMRAKEFTINIPINIKINDDSAELDTPEETEIESDDVGVFVPPLQQEIELFKKIANVKSVYNKDHPQNKSDITNDES